MSRKYPELSHEERFDALQFREDYNEVSLSIPDSNDINGWDIFTMKQVCLQYIIVSYKQLVHFTQLLYILYYIGDNQG